MSSVIYHLSGGTLYTSQQIVGIGKLSPKPPKSMETGLLVKAGENCLGIGFEVLDNSSQFVEPPGFLSLSLLQRLDQL